MTFIATKLFHKAGEGSGGGSDPHNLGFYADLTALQTAHPTGADGDFAILGSTDTVWVWDTGTMAWKDTDTKGQVTSVNGQTGAVVIPDELPSQTGNAGKFLTTDGTDASWSDSIKVDLKLQGKQYGSKALGFPISTNASRFVQMYCQTDDTLAIYTGAGFYAATGPATLKVHYVTPSNVSSIATLGKANAKWGNVYTEKINNGNDITVPTVAGSMAVQVSSMTTADSTLEGQIYQFVGATDATYTNGRFYKCVSDGQDPATYSWEEVSMGGGGSSYTAGTGIDITSGVISVTSPTLTNTATGTYSVSIAGTASTKYGTVNVGNGSNATGAYGVAIGHNAVGNGISIGYDTKSEGNCVAIGDRTQITSGQGSVCVGGKITTNKDGTILVGGFLSGGAVDTILIGFGNNTSDLASNSESGTMAVALKKNRVSATYKLLDYDGTIPTARLTKVNTIVTLAAADWSSGTQTVNVTGMTATGVVLVSPDPTDQSAYTNAGIICSAQAAGTLTFTCSTTPTTDLSVNVVML